jgi:large repetitive protein
VATPFTGVVATFSDTDATATASRFAATINWGDGRTSNGTVQPNAQGGFDVMGTNTFGAAVSTPVEVHIQDFTDPANDIDVANVVQVAPAATTTTITSVTPSPVIAGLTLTITAQVTPSASNLANAGFVEFTDGGLPLGVAPVGANGMATFTTTRLTPGSHSVGAVFLGTRDFNTSTSTAVSEFVRTDVTSQFTITLGRVRRRGRRFVEHVTLMNNGVTLNGPLALVLANLPTGTKLLNASGMTTSITPLGQSFIFLDLGPSNQLPTGVSVGVDLVFSARGARRVRFTPIVLAGLSQP